MSFKLSKEVYLAILVISTLLVTADPFITNTILNQSVKELQLWSSIMVAIAFLVVLASSSLANINIIRRKKQQDWWLGYYFLAMLLITLILGVQKHPFYSKWYESTALAVKATIYAATGIFTISASYRAFRVKNLDSLLLTITAIFTMIGSISVGQATWGGFTFIRGFLLEVTNASYQRAGNIALGIGAIAFGMRSMLGKEKGQIGETTE